MNKFFLLCTAACIVVTSAWSQAMPAPKAPVQLPKQTAIEYINNYKNNVTNFFAYGYLIDLNKAKTVSPTAMRVYNTLSGQLQCMTMVPLNATYKVNTGGTNYMQTESSLCPKTCDIANTGESAPVSGGEVNNMVNLCIGCGKYEQVNAFVVFTPTVNALLNAGFRQARIYNGVDGSNKRYVIYVPVDSRGNEVATDNLWVGDYTNVLTNCKYP